MDKIIISIAKDYSLTPGSRYEEEGDHSGEKFRNEILKSKFDEAIKNKVKLLVDLDGTIGYGTSFLEEVFGGLARIYGTKDVYNTLDFKSDEEPYLIEDIKEYIKNAEI